MTRIKFHHSHCDCTNIDHDLRWEYDDEEVTLSVFLNQWRPWYSRLWIAVKYVFNREPRYGHYDCTNLKDEEVANLVDFLIDFQNRKTAGIQDYIVDPEA